MFPYQQLVVGNKLLCRRIRHRGDKETDNVVGNWQFETISHLQRDKKGLISAIEFDGYNASFDPRHDWSPEGPFPCLISEDNELQFQKQEGV